MLPLTVLPAGAPGGTGGAAVAGLVAARDTDGQNGRSFGAHSSAPVQGAADGTAERADSPAPGLGPDDVDVARMVQAVPKTAEPGRLDAVDALFAAEAMFRD